MARFSLSPSTSCSTRRQQQQPPSESTPTRPSPTASKSPPQWKWNFPPQDQYYRSPSSPLRPRNRNEDDGKGKYSHDSSYDESSEESSEDTDSYQESPLHYDSSSSGFGTDEEEEEEEPPHPLGFESRYGRTRFGLSPRSASNHNHNNFPPPRDIYDREDEYAWNALITIDEDRLNPRNKKLLCQEQSFPPIQSYHLSHSNVSTKKLLKGASSQKEDESMEELLSGMDRIANLVKAASQVDNGPNQQGKQPYSQPRSTAKLLQLAQACERQQSILPREMSALQQQRDQSHRQSCQGFLLLLQADAARVSDANERIAAREREIEEMARQERLDKEAYEEMLQQRRDEAERIEKERIAAEAARTEEEQQREAAKREQIKQAEEEAKEEAAKKFAHVERAKSLIDNLEKVRSGGLKEFDKSKSVGRRRLQFKKIVNGRINTLSQDERKIEEVGRTVCDAISNAANDDAAASSGGEPAMTMGKKYLLDLLCANLVVRVQADGFNGTRGDGFALAGTFAFVSAKCDEISPVLEGHLYTVCPMAIPALSLKTEGEGVVGGGGGSDDNENDLMESLGMIRDKNGEFESFDKFLHRTEGLISVMADIMSSLPSDHTLLGGHRGALTWLQRFLDLMPPAPASPLPLLTAPVLVAFLTGAGHMLANRYPTEFRTMFEAIKTDIANRLDDSPIGVPSATRLRKVLEEWGFEGLRKDLPQGAVNALYDNGRVASAGGGAIAPLSAPTSSALGSSAFGAGDPAPSPFGSDAPASSAFGAGVPASSPFDTKAPAPSPFGAGAPASSPFGTGGPAPSSSPFGAGAPASSPFGTDAPAPSSSPFGVGAPAPSPFGAAPAPSPFGAAPAQSAPGTGSASSPFGANPAPPFGTAPAPSPFGAAPAPSPFGATSGSSTSAMSPFGTAPASSPFGGATPAPSPFGGAAPAPSPFGGAAPAPSPFGAAPAPSPFSGGGQGDGNAGKKKQPCKFFASGKCNFGDRCKFSHEMGGSSSGGGNSNPSPFGNPNGQPSNAFGGSNGGGGGGKKQPCKFFASGSCRNGDQCRYSHESGGSRDASSSKSSTFGTFGTNSQSQSPFGGGGFGGQQPSSNPSPFGGGGSGFGSTTAGFGASPFGQPRR